MVCRECDHDTCGIPQRIQRVDKGTQRAVESQNLVVDFPGVRTVLMSYVIRGSDRYRQHVRMLAVSQVQTAHSRESELKRYFVKPWITGKQLSRARRVRRQYMREGEIFSFGFRGNGIPFRIG